ncbi:MAG: hypothetical protein ACO3C1_00910 [Ilumatobacteraceae bacterium]
MITTGVLGQRWRASITPWGAIEPWGGGPRSGQPVLDWHIAADDRWHSPQHEPAVRQRRVDGTAVVETRVRVPDGDVVQVAYSVPEHGGLTIVEVRNESPRAVAVAFTHGDLLTPRPPSAPIEGIDLPAGSVAFPVGHRASLLVALSHPARRGQLPEHLPTSAGVARGWNTVVDRAGRFVLPDPDIGEHLAGLRCELALCGPVAPDDDPIGFLVGAGQLVRMGERPDAWVPDVAASTEHVLRDSVRRGAADWSVLAALRAAGVVFAAADERRALRDLDASVAALGDGSPLPASAPTDAARCLAWHEQHMVAGGVMLPLGIPAEWLGSSFEAYSIPTGPSSTLSYAVRWHGARPAVLWEQQGEPVTLTAPVVAPGWSSSAPTGEALWPEPPAA